MDFAITALVLQRNPRLSISEVEFSELRSARAALRAAFTLEEIYDLVLGNFHELAVSALNAAVSEMTKWKQSYEEHFDVRVEFNRRSLNLLSAARLYLDQYSQWMKEVGADSTSVRKLANNLYDSHFEYRFMEALRNHVQHVGLAVHGVNYQSKWLPPNKWERMEFSVSPYTSRSALASDAKFKSSVLSECPEQVPIVPTSQVYVQCLSNLHGELRKLVDPVAKDARDRIQAAIARHAEAAAEVIPGLTAVAFEGTASVEEVPLLLDWDDVRIKLAAKNRTLRALGKSYVSSRASDA